MPVPQEIIKLVERFESQREAYQSGKYNEAQIRAEFIDPFFKALGWDIHNERGYAEAYKDVVHEDALKMGGATKAPDLCFRIGGTRKFFVECKKPSINIKEAVHPAYQLRRYAWSARLPLSILTDFDELAVYDCRAKPNKDDSASVCRLIYMTGKQYAEKWDELAAIFSHEAVLKGSFDKYAESAKGKKGTTSVDDAFLEEIERWRALLALNIAIRNEKLSQRELNFAVQRTIDRIIFLRISEDRGIEPYGRLLTLKNGERAYPRLCELFRRADERYNSGLFHFQPEKDRPETPDELTLNLKIDDKVLKDILGNLYYPESPYEFSVLPADILGQVYERFLGKVIRLTAGHQAKVEDKPEVRKAGGVYYTPTYIVDYIVKNTVGKLLEGITPRQAAKLKILDPACGSGSFLLGAYQFLLDWHLVQYMKELEKWTKGKEPKLYQHHKGGWRLTTAERKRILLANIFGVDIDSQAVEVTKLSLLLKVLEGESQETIIKQFELFHQRALPDLGSNIKCGNSLIGSDFYQQQELNLLDDEARYRINAFDWHAEFSEIMTFGGFDAVIGNPPYVRQESLGDDFKAYAKNHFQTFAGTADLYVYFFEQAHRLLRQDGYFGMICSNKFMRANYGQALRNFLSKKTELIQIIDFGELPVFVGAATFPAVFLTINKPVTNQNCLYAPIKRLDFQMLENEVQSVGYILENVSLGDTNWTLAHAENAIVLEKIRAAGKPLDEYVNGKIYRGVLTGFNEAFVIDTKTRSELIKADKKSSELIKLFVVGDDIRKYHIRFSDTFLILIPKGWTNENAGGAKDVWRWFQDNYPALARHLSPFADKAEKRCDKGDYWWELRACDYYDLFTKTKILYPDIAKESRFTIDHNGIYFGNTVYFIPSNDLYLLGVLNSRLIWEYYKTIASVLGDANKGGRLRWFTQDVLNLPIPPPDLNPSLADRLRRLVDQMLDLQKKLAEAKAPHDKESFQRQISATDREIDQLVYELYGLTDEEIKIVENRK